MGRAEVFRVRDAFQILGVEISCGVSDYYDIIIPRLSKSPWRAVSPCLSARAPGTLPGKLLELLTLSDVRGRMRYATICDGLAKRGVDLRRCVCYDEWCAYVDEYWVVPRFPPLFGDDLRGILKSRRVGASGSKGLSNEALASVVCKERVACAVGSQAQALCNDCAGRGGPGELLPDGTKSSKRPACYVPRPPSPIDPVEEDERSVVEGTPALSRVSSNSSIEVLGNLAEVDYSHNKSLLSECFYREMVEGFGPKKDGEAAGKEKNNNNEANNTKNTNNNKNNKNNKNKHFPFLMTLKMLQ